VKENSSLIGLQACPNDFVGGACRFRRAPLHAIVRHVSVQIIITFSLVVSAFARSTVGTSAEPHSLA
jgi:hypothetical protein